MMMMIMMIVVVVVVVTGSEREGIRSPTFDSYRMNPNNCISNFELMGLKYLSYHLPGRVTYLGSWF